jgi:hypothetical protein
MTKIPRSIASRPQAQGPGRLYILLSGASVDSIQETKGVVCFLSYGCDWLECDHVGVD